MRLTANHLRIRRYWRTIVHNATLDVGCGAHGLLGLNGAGKTTLLRCLATGIRPIGGEYRLGDLVVQDNVNKARMHLGYSPQRPAAIRHLTAADQVRYAAWLKGCPPVSSDEAVDNALERVGLMPKRDVKVGRLSGGMLKRLGIAMATVSEPDILLLDEPTAGLDPNARREFYELITQLKRTSTIVISSHVAEDFVNFCDSLTILHEGRTVLSGRLGDVLKEVESLDDLLDETRLSKIAHG